MVGFSDTATVTFVPFFGSPDSQTDSRPQARERRSTEPEPQRPDTDRVVALRVAHALAETQVPILRTLEVRVRDGHVTLRGRVRSYYERQLAHARAKRTAGVVKVSEEISVAG